jgi:hypothetical protein
MKRLILTFFFFTSISGSLFAEVNRAIEVDIYGHQTNPDGTITNVPHILVEQVIDLTLSLIKSGKIQTYKLVEPIERPDHQGQGEDKNYGRVFCVEPARGFYTLDELIQKLNTIKVDKNLVTYVLTPKEACD